MLAVKGVKESPDLPIGAFRKYTSYEAPLSGVEGSSVNSYGEIWNEYQRSVGSGDSGGNIS